VTLSNPNKSDVLDMLSPQQSIALPMLAAGESAKAVAEKLDVTPQTISQWLNHDDQFRYALWLVKKEALDAARSELQLAGTEAVTVVRKLLHKGSTQQIQLKAAQLLLDRLGLVGQYSAKGFDGAAITPVGDYVPPPSDGQSPQLIEAVRVARDILEKFRQRRLIELSHVAPDAPQRELPVIPT
jgi:hypothetical protein